MQDTSNILQDKQTSRYCFRHWQCLKHHRMMMLWLFLCISISARRQLTRYLHWKAGNSWLEVRISQQQWSIRVIQPPGTSTHWKHLKHMCYEQLWLTLQNSLSLGSKKTQFREVMG